MATLSTTQAGASAEYLRYSYGTITKTDRAGDPTLLDFRTIPSDPNFVKLTRGAYITLNTAKYGIWFTGFVTNDAELEYIGSRTVAGVKTPVFGYIYQATSDDYLLNLKPIGIVPPFVNTTQGAILRYLIDILSPAGWTFDVSGIADGQVITRYVIDPIKKFSEVVKDLAATANYQFNIINKVCTYVQQDNAPAGIKVDGSSPHFTPSRLTLKPVSDPVVNDSIILGDIEPQTYFNEYFVGDGATAAFQLVNSVYGVDSAVILDDDFSSSTIDNTKWTVVDAANSYLKPFNGFLNTVGGNNTNSFDIYVQSQSLIPLEGNLRLTHGEYDFTQASDGIVASLWTQDCSADLTKCLYGLRSTKSGANTILRPIINGVVDTSQSLTLDYTKRYNMRTVFGCTQALRLTPQRSYRDGEGAINQYGGTSKPAVAYFQTIITAIDITNGSVSSQTTFLNGSVLLTSAQTFAYYCPVVSNDLHCTLTGVTISSLMQTNLEVKPKGEGGYFSVLMGPNEIDSFDGLAPAATIVDANSGATARSTTLGSPIYNTGQASLTFFKDTTKQVAQTPQPGDLIHLSYRVPGAAMGRVQNRASLTLEASSFNDDGLRTAVIHDLSPLPRTAEECEQAAAAYVANFGYQHYEGSYEMPSGPWFTSEPKSGTILKFQNLPDESFPSYLKAEAVTEVVSTLDGHMSASEIFNHRLTFGPINKLNQFLGTLKSRTDVFTIQDTAEIPTYVDINSVGLSSAPDVTSPVLIGWDADTLFYSAGIGPPAGGGLEVRYSDSSWGADDSKNLITRIFSGISFSVPRTSRGRVCYVRAFDGRNHILWSEDFTNSVWNPVSGTRATTANSILKGPDNGLAQISQVTFGASSSSSLRQQVAVPATTSGTASALSFNVMGTAGRTVTARIQYSGGAVIAQQRVALLGHWQRFTVSGLVVGTGSVNVEVVFLCEDATSETVSLTRCSFEYGTLTETTYCKTASHIYGALSRYAAGVRVALPLPPPAPTATLSFASESSPVVSVHLPSLLQDVWGIEIRANDNSTVLEHQDLSVIGYVPVIGMPSTSTRDVGYYVYTYNLMGEYSTGYHVGFSWPSPSVVDLTLDNRTKMLNWDSLNCKGFILTIDTVDSSMTHLSVNVLLSDNFFQLSDNDFFGERWIKLIPYDDLGQGAPVVAEHSYLPDSLVELGSNEVVVVLLPAGGSTTVTVPAGFEKYAGDYTSLAYAMYKQNIN